MKRPAYFLMLSAALFWLTSCQQKQDEITMPTPTPEVEEKAEDMEPDSVFIHTVFFYFKEGVTAEQRTKFEAELEKLATCESIYKVWTGKPAGTDRDVVDNTYDYAWVVHFENAEQQDLYQVDPIHLAFIEACKDFWERVQVYDSVVKKL
ncbi:MAG: Dabb family protein [Saprospiraceae bacterium]|nr:Dabb family protein [Saprospiraceae bacterium]